MIRLSQERLISPKAAILAAAMVLALLGCEATNTNNSSPEQTQEVIDNELYSIDTQLLAAQKDLAGIAGYDSIDDQISHALWANDTLSIMMSEMDVEARGVEAMDGGVIAYEHLGDITIKEYAQIQELLMIANGSVQNFDNNDPLYTFQLIGENGEQLSQPYVGVIAAYHNQRASVSNLTDRHMVAADAALRIIDGTTFAELPADQQQSLPIWVYGYGIEQQQNLTNPVGGVEVVAYFLPAQQPIDQRFNDLPVDDSYQTV